MYDVYCYAFVVAFKVKKASLAQNRALPTKKQLSKVPTKNRVESAPRVTHGPQRTCVRHGAEHAQKNVLRPSRLAIGVGLCCCL